jgi:hypothetical protein
VAVELASKLDDRPFLRNLFDASALRFRVHYFRDAQ